MNVKRLLGKNLVRPATFKKAVCHFRVRLAHQKSLAEHAPESRAEEQLGDLLEDFFFCAANHEKLSRRADYFQLSDEERPPPRPGLDADEAEDSIQLNTPQRAQPSAFEGSKYDMCTVVEESNEEDAEDSSHRKERRRVSTNKRSERAPRLPDSEPASFHHSAHKTDTDEAFHTPSSRKKQDTADRPARPPALSLASISALVQNFHLGLKAPAKTPSPQQLQLLQTARAEARAAGPGARWKLGALLGERQGGTGSLERQQQQPLRKQKDSKTRMIEKLEKNIFRLFAETKHECKSSKASSKGELQLLPPERPAARASGLSLERALQQRRPPGPGAPRPEGKAFSKSVESDHRDCSKRSSKDSSLERHRPLARADRRNPLRKRLADQHLRIRGTIEKLAPDRFLQSHLEKDKISLSFNLDLCRVLTRKPHPLLPDEPHPDFDASARAPARLHPPGPPRRRKVPQNSTKKPCQLSEQQSSLHASERSASREDSSKSQKTPKKHVFVHAKPLGEFLKRLRQPGAPEGPLTDRSAHAPQPSLLADGARKQRASLGNVHFSARHERAAAAFAPPALKPEAPAPKLAKSAKLDALKLLHRSVEHEPAKLSLIQKKLQHSVLKK